jgi:hypothetical protein
MVGFWVMRSRKGINMVPGGENKQEETVESRYYLQRSAQAAQLIFDGSISVVCGTRESAINHARALATKHDEKIEILLLVGRVEPPLFKEDAYTPF